MKKNRLSLVLALLMLGSFPAFSQTEYNPEEFSEAESMTEADSSCSAANLLRKKYGSVIVTDKGTYTKLTLSIPRDEIENMLTMVVADGWYPKSLVMQVVGDSTAVFLDIDKNQNDSSRRFRVLQKLAAKGALPWKGSVLDNKEAYVTTIETEFGEDFLVKGQALKSNLIFTKLTPRISSIGADKENLDADRFASKKNFDRSKIFTRETYYDNDTGINGQPFFERGTYKEDPEVGRYMVFTLRCRW
ncbi:MAG: hypothetical protein IKO19_12790 [Candidatus Riflebacteria bacterium]|nr:hypothetical protein [Candidatus Riflebacteria bacterium]MBR4571527.1 hypothetical protein [Candidatus Riflebacteria bacterium]